MKDNKETPHTEESKRKIGKSIGLNLNKEVANIFEISSRTRMKLLIRLMKDLKLGCSICGWDKAICDIHHIRGRKIENPHDHTNLMIVCPNCHRLIHTGKIKKIIPLSELIGDQWKSYYYAYIEKRKKIRSSEEVKQLKLEKENRRIENFTRLQTSIDLINLSSIDFSKRGWVGEVAKLIGITPQKVSNWMKRNALEIYETQCNKRKIPIRNNCN